MKNHFLLLYFLLALSSVYAQFPLFEDVTNNRGITDIPSISYLYGNGAAIADFDTDGDLDFFLCTESGIPDRLYVNNGNGYFFESAASFGLNSTDRTRVALWFDYDADEDLDLVTLGDCYLQGCDDPITISLYEQQVNGTFRKAPNSLGLEFGDKYVTTQSIAAGGLAAGDLNNDGYLDLIVSVWGGPISYFENNKNGSFTDKSISSLIGPDFQFRWQPMLFDFNDDGYLDIYCSVDFDSNEMWINKGDGTFENMAAETFSDSAFNEMGLTLGDYDNDGDMDIYATNISRVSDGVLRHNILLKNLQSTTGLLVFSEVANSLQVGASGWDWGTTFFDSNNDGRLDLVTTNGWTPSEWAPDDSKLWLNLGDGLFGDISVSSSFNDTYDATSLMAFDMDRDGDLDLLQTLKSNRDIDLPLLLYENKLNENTNNGNYIVIKPRTEEANHFAIGSVVKVRANGENQMRLISAGTSLYGQEPAEAFFGIGSSEVISELKIIWPDKSETVLNNVDVNQEITIYKNRNLSIEKKNIQKVDFYPNPVNNTLTIDINSSHSIVKLFNPLGQVLLEHSISSGSNSIDLSFLKAGTYFISISDSNYGQYTNFKILKN